MSLALEVLRPTSLPYYLMLPASGSFLGLDTGLYTINAIDANGCFTTRNENIAPSYTLSVTLDTAAGISCSGLLMARSS